MAEQVPVPQDQPTKPKRFVEKGPHVVYDTKTKVYWMKKDSWQDKGKFLNWHESRDYADKKNLRKIGGYGDWRLPSIDEATSLFDEEATNVAKGGATIHIDEVFPEGGFKHVWLMGDTSTRRPRFDFVEGKVTSLDEYSFGATRLCRKDLVKKDHTRPPVRN
ncbi:MAG: hypothetical protein NPINA01_23740 [Nitrospinaceae bacterium]|nr:MAG: hypothetical protein NPINA01_23740 [Nitrospinaceae bacterium]